MLIRSPISRDFFEQEPHSVDWIGAVIWFIAALAVAAALVYATVNFGMGPFEFDELG